MPQQVTAYKCQYCGTKYVRLTLHAVKQHEKWCYSRPENQPMCWDGCKHYENKVVDGDEVHYHYCAKQGTPMESAKMRVRREAQKMSYACGPEMPKVCPDFDDGMNEFRNSDGSWNIDLGEF